MAQTRLLPLPIREREKEGCQRRMRNPIYEAGSRMLDGYKLSWNIKTVSTMML